MYTKVVTRTQLMKENGTNVIYTDNFRVMIDASFVQRRCQCRCRFYAIVVLICCLKAVQLLLYIADDIRSNRSRLLTHAMCTELAEFLRLMKSHWHPNIIYSIFFLTIFTLCCDVVHRTTPTAAMSKQKCSPFLYLFVIAHSHHPKKKLSIISIYFILFYL